MHMVKVSYHIQQMGISTMHINTQTHTHVRITVFLVRI